MISRFECISLVLTARHSRKDRKVNRLLKDQKFFSAKYPPLLKSCAGFEVLSGSLNFLFSLYYSAKTVKTVFSYAMPSG